MREKLVAQIVELSKKMVQASGLINELGELVFTSEDLECFCEEVGKIYGEEMTVEELQMIVNLYTQPGGMSLLEKLGKITERSAELALQWVVDGRVKC